VHSMSKFNLGDSFKLLMSNPTSQGLLKIQRASEEQNVEREPALLQDKVACAVGTTRSRNEISSSDCVPTQALTA
jgi:hypothetical protein